MRESNFIFPAHNRACVCISSTLYDRRALDAPAASLPLVNSLTHLSYLTATSARIRESLSSDGGLERLVRILQNCANPTALPTSLADVKGKGPLLPKRKARKSPFKAFADYDLLPSLDELRDLQGGDAAETLLSLLPSLPQTSPPSNLHLPPSLKARHLLYTYTLAFQCIVNIGVRGSEAIRTRVVEAGALEVVVHVLERYLEEIERKRVRNQVDWHKAEQARIAQAQLQEVQAMMEGGRSQQQQQEEVVVIVDTSSPVIPAAPTPTRPRLTRINIVAASSSAAVAEGLAPPSRVQTPDTILSTDDASLTGDDNGSSSGQETEEITMSTSTSEAVEVRMSIKAEGSRSAGQDEGGETAPVVAATDDNGDVMMSGPSSPVEERSEAEVEGGTSGQEEERQPTPRSAAQPGLPPAPTSAHRTPRATESRGPRHPHHPHHATPPSASPLDSTPPLEPEGQLYFRDEDVLLALQLLAYLSKYPHVREVFHCPSSSPSSSGSSSCDSDCEEDSPMNPTSFAHSHPLIRPHSVNIFSLVELFTHRPPSDDPFTPRLSNEVQYWACTIMRNACRKDEQRGGIRQCANMNCGKWEQYAREFAKCRRCRRAKYCSKACQSASWGNGHKFWCHKQTTDDRSTRRRTTDSDAAVDSAGVATPTNASPSIPNDPRRRQQQQRHRRTGGEDDEEDDFDELPPQPQTLTTPHGTRTPGPTARNRSGTIPTNPIHHHHHPLVQPTNLPGLEAVTGNGQVDAGGMPLGVDEDLIAREMMEMGDQQGVRVQDA